MKRCVMLLVFLLLLLPFAAAYGVVFYNPAWNPQDGKIYDEVLANEPYELVVRVPDIAITKIVFYVDDDYQNAGITVYNLKSFPEDLPDTPDETTYELNELKYSGFVPHQTVNFVYYFKVNKTWLEENAISRNSIALHYYDSMTDAWIPLKTDIQNDDESFVYYKAEYKGVHYLYIGTTAGVESAPLETDETEVEEIGAEPVEKDDTAALTEVTAVDLTKKPQVTQTPVQQEEAEPVVEPHEAKDDSVMTIALLLVLAVLIFIVIVAFARRGKKGVDKDLHSYVCRALKQGKSKSEIRERLLEVGWHEERVDRVLRKYKDKKKEVSAFEAAVKAHEEHKPAKQVSREEPHHRMPGFSTEKREVIEDPESEEPFVVHVKPPETEKPKPAKKPKRSASKKRPRTVNKTKARKKKAQPKRKKR